MPGTDHRLFWALNGCPHVGLAQRAPWLHRYRVAFASRALKDLRDRINPTLDWDLDLTGHHVHVSTSDAKEMFTLRDVLWVTIPYRYSNFERWLRSVSTPEPPDWRPAHSIPEDYYAS